MITIPNLDYTSDIKMPDALRGATKSEMFKIVRKLDLFVSQDLDGEVLVTRFVEELIKADIEILCALDKQELKIVEEFVNGGPNTHVVRKMRTKPYLLQKYCIVLTYCDEENKQWHFLMPDEMRESLAKRLPYFLDLAKRGLKPASARQIRLAAAVRPEFRHRLL